MSTNGVRAAIYLRVSRDDQTPEKVAQAPWVGDRPDLRLSVFERGD